MIAARRAGPMRVLLIASALLAFCPGVRVSAASASKVRAAAASSSAAPRLLLVLVIDQLRSDRVSSALPGGIGRLARRGRVFTHAALEHAATQTCPGHATILSGRHPGPAGIPANRFFVKGRSQAVYCAADESTAGEVLGVGARPADRGRSPHRLRVDTLGDWLKAAHPGSRVFALSAKDRAAIMLGGKHPDAVYWLDGERTGRFTTSRYYEARLPSWVRRWDAERLLGPLPARWQYANEEQKGAVRRDDYPAESARFGRTSPHPLKMRGDRQGTLARLMATPYLDQRTLDFARDLVHNEKLGEDEQTDLLAISLSATDYIGHYYGPRSQEARVALRRLDRDLGGFLDYLEQRVGRDRFFVVLTADHGVLPLPEWLRENEPERARCPVASGRISPAALEKALARHLSDEFGGGSALLGGSGGVWFERAGFSLRIDRERVRAAGASVERVAERLRVDLEQQPGVARVWSASAIERGEGPEPMATLYRHSWAQGRGGDLLIQPARGCLFTSHSTGTSHGSPWPDDRRVPLIFFGPGVGAGQVSGRARTVDIAPTLATILSIEAPEGIDGHPLPLR